MDKPIKFKTDTELKEFIKQGGRPGAKADFEKLLKKATGPSKPKTSAR